MLYLYIVRESDYSPLQCLACSKRPECLRILSGNVILTSIKGHNSLVNLRKMTANHPNVDLVSINTSIKFGQNLSICSQNIEQKQIFGSKSRAITLVQMCEKNDV